jgi:hypothetical protein
LRGTEQHRDGLVAYQPGPVRVVDRTGRRRLRLHAIRHDRRRRRRPRAAARRDPGVRTGRPRRAVRPARSDRGSAALLRESHVAERVRLAEGSFFDGVPQGADAYVLTHIIHDWDDDGSIQILRNVRSAAAPGAALLLVETVIPEDDCASVAKWTDMEMLIINDGRECTANEYRRLFDEAGFEMVGVVDTASRFSVIEGRAV